MRSSQGSRRYIPLSQLPNAGDIPSRGTRDAVIHLLRLAKSKPVFNGQALEGRLTWLAAKLNAKLTTDQQVAPHEAGPLTPFSGEDRAIAEFAVASIGAYVTNPAIQPTVEERHRAFLMLERYFVWCRGLWQAVESAREAAAAFRFDAEAQPAVDDIREHSLGTMLHWLASICVVIEGWEELNLTDRNVDALLNQGGNIKDAGSLRYRLQRFRNGVFHFQVRGTEDARFTDFWNNDVVRWAVPLERAFERFFRHAWDTQQETLDPWLYSGLEPRYDPELEE